MKQSRLMSLVESVANVIVGYGVAVVTQILIFPVFRPAHHAGAEPEDGCCVHRGEYREVLRLAAAVRGDPGAEIQIVCRTHGVQEDTPTEITMLDQDDISGKGRVDHSTLVETAGRMRSGSILWEMHPC